MIHQNEQYLKARWLEYWNRENHDRPILSITAPIAGAKRPYVRRPSGLEETWLDGEYIIARARADMECTFYGGEAFPSINPNLGPDILGAVCGCGIRFGTDTSWAEPCVPDWNGYPDIRFDEQNPWWQAILEITKRAADDAHGDYLVGITDLHPGADALVSLRGAEEACMDAAEQREQFIMRTEQVFGVHKEMVTRLCGAISVNQTGATNWMGIWHPSENWYVTSCDFSCLVSERDFEELIVPGLELELTFLPASIYHLDGPGALRHLDRILRLPGLDGVQWVPGAGQPPAREWIPVLRKIQEAGKQIQIHCDPEDILLLCEALRPEGVHLVCSVSSEDEAQRLLTRACECSKK